MLARPQTVKKAISAIETELRVRKLPREEVRQAEARLRKLNSLLLQVRVG